MADFWHHYDEEMDKHNETTTSTTTRKTNSTQNESILSASEAVALKGLPLMASDQRQGTNNQTDKSTMTGSEVGQQLEIMKFNF